MNDIDKIKLDVINNKLEYDELSEDDYRNGRTDCGAESRSGYGC